MLDCDECEEPGADECAYCADCPYDPTKVLRKAAARVEGFPPVEEAMETLMPVLHRAFALRADIEILGGPLNDVSEAEMEALRILKEEEKKLEFMRMKESERKGAGFTKTPMPARVRRGR